MKTHKKAFRLGVFFALLLPFWVFWAQDELNEMPPDFSYSAEITSIDNFYDESRNEYTGEQYSKTNYSYEAIKSDDQNIILKHIFDVRTLNDEAIFQVEREYGVDRYTGKHVPGIGDKDREGYLFAPRDLKKGEPFTYWHINYDGPAEMNFVGEELIHGLNTYHYEADYSQTRIDQTENLSYLPGVGTERGILVQPSLELWVEPKTGYLVKYQDDTTAYYYNLETGELQNPWNHFTNQFSEDSVVNKVKEAKFIKVSRRIFNFYIPSLLAALSLYFLGLAFLPKKILRKTPKGLLEKLVSVGALSYSLFVFTAWTFDLTDLTQLTAESSSMNPLTALLFSTTAVLVLVRDRFKYLHSLLAFVIIIIPAWNILSNFGWLNTYPDLIFFKQRILETEQLSRMALFTSFSFLSLGLAEITSRLKKDLYISEIICTFVLLFSLTANIGHLFGFEWILNSDFFVSTSIGTAVLAFLFSFILLKDKLDQKKIQLSRKNSSIIFLVLFTMILGSSIMAIFVDTNLQQESRDSFDGNVESIYKAINERFNIYINTLHGGRGLFDASESVNRAEWKAYIESLDIQKNYPGIQGVGYAIFIEPENLENHIQSVRAEGFPEFRVHPEGERDIYSSIVYLEPFDLRNQQAFGYDMFSNELRRNAMEQARDTGLEKLSARITLVQEIDEDVQAGFLVYVPVYKTNTNLDSLEARRENIVGYVYAAFRSRDLIDGILLNSSALNKIHLEIYDGVFQNENTELYNSSKEYDSSKFTTRKVIYLADRPWTLVFESSPDFGENIVNKLIPVLILLFGLFLSVLISLIFYSFNSAQKRAEAYAKKATKYLRKRTNELESTNARDEAILRSIGEALIVTNAKGEITFANSQFTKLTGWKENEYLGKKLDLLIPMSKNGKTVQGKQRPIYIALHAKKTVNSNKYSYQVKNGHSFRIALSVSPITLNEKVIGVVEVFRDITKEIQIDQAKTEFVSLASHQLRTPLSAIRWYLEILESGDLGKVPKKQMEVLSDIQSSTQKMNQLVNDLLDVSKLELGTFTHQSTKLDINKVTQEIIKEQTPKYKAKKIKIETLIQSKIPELRLDKKHYQIILQNLLSNALKYSPEKTTVSIKLQWQSTKKQLILEVKDQGFGIPLDQQDKIFSKLFRAKNILAHDTEGTGLGLYIIHSILKQHKGKIQFKSTPNKGTTFTVTMPAKSSKN